MVPGGRWTCYHCRTYNQQVYRRRPFSRTYSSLRTRKVRRALQRAATPSQLSSRFLLKSSSVIFRFCAPRLLSMAAMHAPSSTTTRSSCSSASCRRIFSNPTSSTVLPLMWISFAVAVIFSALVEAYFFFSASNTVKDLSLVLEGRMKDAAVGEALRPGSYEEWVYADNSWPMRTAMIVSFWI